MPLLGDALASASHYLFSLVLAVHFGMLERVSRDFTLTSPSILMRPLYFVKSERVVPPRG